MYIKDNYRFNLLSAYIRENLNYKNKIAGINSVNISQRLSNKAKLKYDIAKNIFANAEIGNEYDFVFSENYEGLKDRNRLFGKLNSEIRILKLDSLKLFGSIRSEIIEETRRKQFIDFCN